VFIKTPKLEDEQNVGRTQNAIFVVSPNFRAIKTKRKTPVDIHSKMNTKRRKNIPYGR
jgi:hypothetical protein